MSRELLDPKTEGAPEWALFYAARYSLKDLI
jgi:hypothetical protein